MANPLEIPQRIEAVLKDWIGQAGLVPAWNTDVRQERTGQGFRLGAPGRSPRLQVEAEVVDQVEHPEALVDQPAGQWSPDLLALWHLGLIHLRDARTFVPPSCVITGSRVVLRACRMAPYVSVQGDDIAIEECELGPYFCLEGPAMLRRSWFSTHCQVGPIVWIDGSWASEYVKVQRFVEVEGTALGAFMSAMGRGYRGDQYPLPGTLRGASGISIGRKSWIGQHASLLPGARLGEGVAVASGTVLFDAVGDHVLVTGTPGRALVIDFHLRGLSAEEAYRSGREQGPSAAGLPVYGEADVAFDGPRVLELDYPRHGVLRDLAGENLLDFQRGALEAALAWLLPRHRFEVSCHRARSVRFRVRFEQDVPLHRALSDELLLQAVPGAGQGVSPLEARVLEALAESTSLSALSRRLFLEAIERSEWPPPVTETVLGLAQRGLIDPPLLPAPADVALESTATLSTLAPALLSEERTRPLPPLGRAEAKVDRVAAPLPPAAAGPGPKADPGIREFLIQVVKEMTSLEAVDVHETFVRLGLSSVSLSDLATRIEQELQVEAPDLLAFDTVAKLEGALAASRGRPSP